MLREKECLTVRDSYKRLVQQVKDDKKVLETPVRYNIDEGDETIFLRPMRPSKAIKDVLENRTLALLSITISLSQKPDRPALKKLQQWLTLAAPRSISAITVERVLLQTENIQSFLQQQNKPELVHAIAKDLQQRKQIETLTFQTSPIESMEPDRSRGMQETRAQSTFAILARWADRVYQSIQRNVLLNPDFYSDKDLEQLQLSEPAKALGLSDSAKLSLLNTKLKQPFDPQDMRALSRNDLIIEKMSTVPKAQYYG